MIKKDLVIIGGGSAGLAAAIKAYELGIKDVLILEKENELGGILNQCIHSGFGIVEFQEELTGPEYYSRFVTRLNELGIEYFLNTQVLNIEEGYQIEAVNPNGVVEITCKAIILATGCYERNAGAINLPGDRPSGVLTAGTAQKLLNTKGYLVGKRVVILGSGDIGLIMARRFTLEGAKVICVAEIMPRSNGLNRNIAQCLNDFNIPLYLSTTVTNVIGKGRIEKVELSDVDSNLNIVRGTEREIECDTLVLSIGLVPYIDLLKNMGAKLTNRGTLVVDEHLETSLDGVFACGNCLHVHDIVDNVTAEARVATSSVKDFFEHKLENKDYINVLPDHMLSYVLPQQINLNNNDDIFLKFRVKDNYRNAKLVIKQNGNALYSKIIPILNASEMVIVKVPAAIFASGYKDDIKVTLEAAI